MSQTPLSLSDINTDEELQFEFKKFAQKEQSYENILFLQNVKKFKNLNDNLQLLNKAIDIVESFLMQNSRYEINVDRQSCDKVEKYVNSCPTEISKDLFDTLAGEVELTIKDTLLRFNKSNHKLDRIRSSMFEMEVFPWNMTKEFLSNLIDKITHKDFGFDVRTRKWRFKEYPNVFVASEAVDYMTRNKFFDKLTRDMATDILCLLSKLGLFRHSVENEKIFSDDFLFFRFAKVKKEVIVKNYVDIKIIRRKLRNDDLILEFWHDLTDKKFGIDIKDRVYNLKVYPSCFLGSEAVDWICNYYSIGKDAAIILGNQYIGMGMFHHVAKAHGLKDDYLFYCLGDNFEDELKKWRSSYTPRSMVPFFSLE